MVYPNDTPYFGAVQYIGTLIFFGAYVVFQVPGGLISLSHINQNGGSPRQAKKAAESNEKND